MSKNREKSGKMSSTDDTLVGLTGGPGIESTVRTIFKSQSPAEKGEELEDHKDGGLANVGLEEYEDYADKLIEEYHLKTLDDTDEIWYYEKKKGIFVPGAETIIKARIEHDYKGKIKNRDIGEYIGQIQRRTYT
ncbi:MAG TPA: hypothetical protein VE130_16075, partial [Nitrososphaeraceae archaeon]|nr:hypothetical protein [Nitrososphaeraceae archaeon]